MNDEEETRAFWDAVADDWDVQVGEDGDSNRILNSDPVLWKFVGEVAGRTVLDAGSGTGYLSRKLHDQGARVIGVDLSARMCGIARSKSKDIDFRVDSCSALATVGDESIDLIVSNYVLMDAADLLGTVLAFSRVLKPGGDAVLIFSHPCFPQGSATRHDDGSTAYHWPASYFSQAKRVDPPWNHFRSEFIWFHRPLSDYWKAFREAGFDVLEFEEPRVSPDRFHLAANPSKLESSQTRPFSVAFKLRKPQA